MRTAQRLALCTSLTALLAVGSVRSGFPAPATGKPAPDLFLAVGRGDLAAVKTLLARGANPNARNFLMMTPLMYAALRGEVEISKALLARGAELDAVSQFGSALTFAGLGDSESAARFLLSRGARIDSARTDKITSLMLAARSGHLSVVRELLQRKAKLDGRDTDGMTALMYAARSGRTEVVRELLRQGAVVDATDRHRWTALTFAASNGHTNAVSRLLEAGANPNVRDERGRTPLLIASSYGDRPEVVRALLDGGARRDVKDNSSQTAVMIAARRGNAATLRLLEARAAVEHPVSDAAPARDARAAIAVSLPLLERSMRVFSQRTACVSCHHEGLGRVATGLAKERGVSIDTALAGEQAKRIAGFLSFQDPLVRAAVKDGTKAKEVAGTEIGEEVPILAFALSGVAAHNQPATPELSRAALFLARRQTAAGFWDFKIVRAPMQSSRFAMTALAIRTMRAYVPKDQAEEVDWRLRRARRWLASAPAKSNEDRAYRLLGLAWSGAGAEERQPAIEALRAAQRPDGGWAQLPGVQSDAYATGQALFALHQGGIAVDDPAYRRGVQFLLRTQDEDGSWFVTKRAVPANNYFDAGFPHGQSQYASHAATCWATMALLLTVDSAPAAPQTAARPK
jgi:ankyrin repeat protein